MSYVVIGAGFGDEGKGLMTDALVRRVMKEHNTTAVDVVRFNGGAQAGHTVVDGDRSHVFGHVGAGTFAGAGTYLGSKFIVNPTLLLKELNALERLSLHPNVNISPNALISTVYDVLLNQISEQSRTGRHGSCGVGINETVTRYESGFGTQDESGMITDLHAVMEVIRNDWVEQRLSRIENPVITAAQQQILDLPSSVIADGMISDFAKMMDRGALFEPTFTTEHLVFEGAQGLALDEFLGEYPHVTRSITGLAMAIAEGVKLGVRVFQPVYVTRAYSTRHGAGPLLRESEPVMASGSIPVDTTNIHNAWQGTLRFAPLNLGLMTSLIKKDLERARYVAQVLDAEILDPQLVVTCMDQLDSDARVQYPAGRPFNIAVNMLPQFILGELRAWTDPTFKLLGTSWGPQNTDVRFAL